MSILDKAVHSQLINIQNKTGKTFEELATIVKKSGLTKHSEIREKLMSDLRLGYGDANALVHAILQSDGTRAAQGKPTGDVLDEIYSGSKADLRPIHEALMEEIAKFGEFEIVPKKGYVSLRRKRQFAMLGPATNTRFELGINIKDLPPDGRLIEQPKGSMCNYIVKLFTAGEVDVGLVAWVRSAYEGAG